MILLVQPPVVKPCEPPAGIGRLSGMLTAGGIGHRLWDANLEGLLHLMSMPLPAERPGSAWTRRAFRNRDKNLSLLRDPLLYGNRDRYSRVVKDLGRVLAEVTLPGFIVGLANYEDRNKSPLRSGDLLAAAERPEDDPFSSFFMPGLRRLLHEREPSFVGISLNYLSQALCAFSMAGFLRREAPQAKIILGGGLVTSWMRNPGWKNPFGGLVDHMVAGPGESALLSILGRPGNTASFSMPSYEHLPLDQYLSPGFVLPYAASSGCSWGRCSFCPEKVEGNAYSAVPAGTAMANLKALTSLREPGLIHLLENAISPALLDGLAAAGPGVPWYGFARVGSRLADPDFCRQLKLSGCVMLKLGIESGDQAVLDALDKGIRLETASVVLRNLRRAGIGTYVYLIFGTPPEDETSARKTLAFTEAHHDCIDFLNLAIFNMPVCGASDEVRTREFSEGDLSLYTDFVHPRGWDRRRVRRFLDREFKTRPAISAILKNEPPVFTSNHAPFFLLRRG